MRNLRNEEIAAATGLCMAEAEAANAFLQRASFVVVVVHSAHARGR